MGDDGWIHHGFFEAHLPATDLERSIAFYERLGFAVAHGSADQGGVLLLFERGGTRSMLGLFLVGEVSHRHPAEYHVAFRVPGTRADDMVPWLRERGIEPEHPETAPQRGVMREPIVHGWMPAASVFFRDPDGHLLELIAELDEDARPEARYTPLSQWRRTSGGVRS